MSIISFRRPDGHVFLTAERNHDEGWIHARWTGIQTLESIQRGGMAYVDMLRQESCPKLLNDHSELIGRFTEANEWIAQVWTPLILQAGLRYFAHVLSPGIFGQLSIEDLSQRIEGVFDLRTFGDLEEAKAWLRSVG